MKIYIYTILLSLLNIIYADLLYPENNSILNYTHILFEWEQISNADSYQFQLSTNDDFTTIILDTIDSSLIHIEKDNINWSNIYYWRIRPLKNSNPIDDWSEHSYFETSSPISNASSQMHNENQYSDGITIFGAFFDYFSAAIDKNGNEIWNTGDNDIVYYNTDYYGNLFGCELRPELEHNIPGLEFNLDSDILWEEPNDEFMHHDIIRLPNGNYLGITETIQNGPVPNGPWTPICYALYGPSLCNGVTEFFPWHGDKIIEWDKETQEIVWEWNTFENFNMNDYDDIGGSWEEGLGQARYDWTHVNALWFSENESAIYISVRHLSRIVKIDYPSGDIIWSMGLDMPSGDIDFGEDILFSWQHSLQILDNGNLLTLDNGNLSQQLLNTDFPTTRALEIAINEENGTYSSEVVWEYNLPDYLFGFASGNAQKLDNDNYLITTVGNGGTSIEINQSGDVIWEGNLNLTLPNGAVYRSHRVSGLYPIAFSIIGPDFSIINSEKIIELTEGDNTIEFIIYNDGDKTETFSYSFSDTESYFDNISSELTIPANNNMILTFNGNINADNPTELTLTVIPNHRLDLEKNIVLKSNINPLSFHSTHIKDVFLLSSPYPNPFNPTTNFDIQINKFSNVEIDLYTMLGEKVKTIFNGALYPGEYTYSINNIDLSTGEYLIKLKTNNKLLTQKVTLIK